VCDVQTELEAAGVAGGVDGRPERVVLDAAESDPWLGEHLRAVGVADQRLGASADGDGLGAAGEAGVLVWFDHPRREDPVGVGNAAV
jgi:hypothetical protein